MRQIMSGPRADEARRLDRIAEAMRPECVIPTVELPKDPLPVMQNMARKSRTNMLPLVLDTFSQVIKADGHSNDRQWGYWQANQCDARQTGVHRSAMQNGAAYATVLPGEPAPVIEGISARHMTAVYQNPTRDEWPMLALHVDGSMVKLYDEEKVYYIGVENQPRSGLSPHPSTMYASQFTYLESRTHGLSVCPVVRFRDRMLLEGEEQYGIIEPLVTIQERVDETVFGLMVAQFYAAFKQRYVIGWVPQDETEQLAASASNLWTFEDADVKVGQLDETDLTRYLTSKDSALHDMAAIAQIPVQSLGSDGISNISADTLAGMEAGKERKSDEIRTSFGESWEQVLRTCSLIDGDDASANDFSSQLRWKNTTARALGATVDALVKMVTSLGVSDKVARQFVPDWTDQLEAANAAAAGASGATSADPLQAFLASMDRQEKPGAQGANPV
jgi:hypothetical protein